MFKEIWCVAIGGALGAASRHLVSVGCEQAFGSRFPWGTLLVNVVGCFLLGWLIEAAEASESISDAWKLTIGTGFLGALTTFSTFGVQTHHAWQRSPTSGILNVVANVLVGLIAAGLGMYLASRWYQTVPS